MFPIIPLAGFAAIVSGLLTLTWYSTLSVEDQGKFDRLVGHCAWELFQTGIESLSESQRAQVIDLAREMEVVVQAGAHPALG